MEQADLDRVTRTYENYRVKNLRFNKVENIIIGQVEDPLTGRKSFNDGFVTVVYRVNGFPIKQYKGREDLRISV